MKEGLNTVIYQSQNEIWVIESSGWQKYQFKQNIKPIRLLFCETTEEFMQHIQDTTQEELITILLEELNNNQGVLYSQ